MRLYHADIGLPAGFRAPQDRVRLEWTRHADAERTDRYGDIPRVATLPLSMFKVVEVGVEGNRVAKLVVRGHLDKSRDAVFVLIPGKTYRVKTVWINLRSDSHSTLDRSRYVR